MIDLDAIKARLARVVGKWPTKGAIAPGADEFGPKAWAAHGPLRCHATEQGSARGWTQANADANFIAHAPGDIAALVAEVERLRTGRDVTRCYADRVEAEVLALRTEAATMRSWAEEAAKAENENAEDAKRERAAVVVWLRDLAMDSCEWSERAVVYDSCAFAIESGEHRREETE